MKNTADKRRFKRFNVDATIEMKRWNKAPNLRKLLLIRLLDLSADGFGFLTHEDISAKEKAYVVLPLAGRGNIPCMAEVVHVNKRGANYRAGARIV